MKRLFVMILALLLIGSFALAETVDFASMTDDELNALIAGAQAELKNRKGGDDEYWYNEGGIVVYPAGAAKFDDFMKTVEYAIAVENGSDEIINVSCEFIVNGWDVTTLGVIDDVAPGKSKKDFASLFTKDIGVASLDDIETLEVTFEIYNDDYDTIAEVGPITANLN